jgi:hypothetical protein
MEWYNTRIDSQLAHVNFIKAAGIKQQCVMTLAGDKKYGYAILG